VSALHFESGADVKAGTLLVELQSADDLGKLQSLKATAALAQITLDRDQKQIKVQGVSQQQVDADQHLAAGTTMVTIQSLDPIFVDFNLPQQSVSQLKVGQKVKAKVDTFPGKLFPGEITAINPKIDA